MFGLVDLDSFELDGIKIFTRFWGMLMFGTYSVINIVVLLNLLIAMMNHSYQLISVSNIPEDRPFGTALKLNNLICRNGLTLSGNSRDPNCGLAISRKVRPARRPLTSFLHRSPCGTYSSGSNGNSVDIQSR